MAPRHAPGVFFAVLLAWAAASSGAQAQQPPAPAAPNRPPTSTSGTQLMPPDGATMPPPPAADAAAEAAQEKRIADLEARMDQGAGQLSHEDMEKLHWLRGFTLSGFLQPEIIWQWFNAAASPNAGPNGLPPNIGANDVVAKSDGTTTNADMFRLRRARVRLEYMPSEGARFVLEIDPTPAGGPTGGVGTIARTVEAQGIVHWNADVVTEFAAGIFRVPFGWEVLQNDADRPFIEHSWAEQNLFPGEFDTGARAYTTLMQKRLVVQAAFVNGATLGEKTFAVIPDLNHGKDLVARVNYDLGIADFGISGYYGQGQVVDPLALRFKQFPRWGIDLEAALHHRFTQLGETRVLGEFIRAKNLDRGVNYGALSLPAIPADVFNGSVEGLDELGYWIRVEQDLTRWLTLGLRYDFYTPNSAQATDGRDTIGLVAVAHFTTALQLMAGYDHATDNVHVPGAPPPSRNINTLSGVLQVRF